MPDLTAREVCQRLREAALGIHALQMLGAASADGEVCVDIDGWTLHLDFAGEKLHLCQHCRDSNGRIGNAASWQRYGTDPVALLSTWELAQIERLLRPGPAPAPGP